MSANRQRNDIAARAAADLLQMRGLHKQAEDVRSLCRANSALRATAAGLSKDLWTAKEQLGEVKRVLNANHTTLCEQRRRCVRWGKSHAELDAAIEDMELAALPATEQGEG